ncbi:MAG: hypothetical protein ACFFED_17310, partial [Candidatus Thorarchaeota archaeon]
IASAVTNRFGTDLPVVACFGNDENIEDKEDIREIVENRIIFLEGESRIIRVNNQEIGILGVPLLNVANSPQDMPLERVLKSRIGILAEKLRELKSTCQKAILLMHYSPISTDTYPASFTWWISEVFANVSPDYIIHGHIHYATNPEAQIGSTKVMNVAYPATRKITEINVPL